jgi:hypothetical protein
MTGMQTIHRIRRLEDECAKLGLKMVDAKHYYKDYGDTLALIPLDQNALPIYSRDAEIFVGTLEDLAVWLRGVQWARHYDQMTIGKVNDKRRERREQDWRNRKLVDIIKGSEESN